MAYHTVLYFALFLPVVLLLYQLTPRKYRWITLLGAGYLFFWSFSGKLLLFLIGTTLFTHYIGIWLSDTKQRCKVALEKSDRSMRSQIKKQYKKKERWILTGGVVCLLGVLAYLKYYNFFAQNANTLLGNMKSSFLLEPKALLLPIGISFYTLQAVSYMADVYWGKIPAVRHLGKVALFLGFFPQIMEGPISMYHQTGEQLFEGKPLSGENLSAGAVRILWGLFKKMIIADRLYLVVTAVFDHYEQYSGVIVAVAAVAYTVQLYMEFSGTMDIVIGSGRMFGVALPENFRQPFASRNAADFWRRWHMTLGAWFKTYIFYPVSVSGFVKKWNQFGRRHFGKYVAKLGVSAFALFPVWICNGLWHGAGWHYIFYGMYYFVILMWGIAVEPVRNTLLKRMGINENVWWYKTAQILKTWIIIFTGELFFRANGLRAGVFMFQSMFREIQPEKLWDGTLLSFGLDKADFLVIVTGCLIVAVVGMVNERKLLGKVGLPGLPLPARWGVYYALILAVLVFGAYGIGYQQVDLIYAGF